MSCHVMSCHVMSCHVMSCHVLTLIFYGLLLFLLFFIILHISCLVSSCFTSIPYTSLLFFSLLLYSFLFFSHLFCFVLSVFFPPFVSSAPISHFVNAMLCPPLLSSPLRTSLIFLTCRMASLPAATGHIHRALRRMQHRYSQAILKRRG